MCHGLTPCSSSRSSISSAIALAWIWLCAEQIRKWSATASSARRSSATRSVAFLASAASAASRSRESAEARAVERERAVTVAGCSMVAVHGVVDRVIERTPRRCGAFAVQQVARLLGQLLRALPGVVESARPPDQIAQARPLGGRPALAERERAERLAVALGREPQGGDQRQGDLAVGEVGADRLAGDFRLGQVVEQIVHD